MARTNVVRIAESSTSGTLWSRLQAAIAPAYRLERELGGGGMSRVFLATRSDSRLVAVKVLADGAADLLELRRFRQEVAISTALRHPHVLPVLASGEEAGLAWFVTPFIAQGSLRDMLGRHGRLAPSDTVRLLGDVADALAYAHACGVVHGDIKPENVLLSNGRALLADFGGARLRFLRHASRGSDPDAPVIGTPLYMSPEQAAGETTFDGRADLYALGVVGWELLTGRPPFTAADPRSVLLAHLGAPVPSLRSHRGDVPERLAILIERMLSKDPEERPRSAFVVRTALDAALERPAPRRTIARARPALRDSAAHRARRPLTVTALTRAAASLLATVVTGGALAAAAGLLPTNEAPAPISLAGAAAPVFEEPIQLPRMQELDPLVIRGHAARPASAPAAPPPPPAPPAPPAAPVAHVLAEAEVRAMAELQHSAVAIGKEAATVAMRFVRSDGQRVIVGDSVRIHVNAAHAEAVRQLAAAGIARGTALRQFEVRSKGGSRRIEVIVPCAPPAPPTPPAPPAADCGARIAVPVTRPVGA